MKKNSIVNLIKYYADHNDNGFRAQAADIALEFNEQGDSELSDYIMSLISTTDVFVPQQLFNQDLEYCQKISTDSPSIFLPTELDEDIQGIINAIGYNAGINRFMLSGAPGTGKTETVKQIARILDRELYAVDFNLLIDSKLGQTSKNIADLFNEINNLVTPDRVIILLDEIDSLAMERMNSNDIREMGRATSALIKGLDSLNPQITMFATTNLINQFDRALLRRFDTVVNFNRYSKEDLLDLSEILMDQYIKVFNFAKKDNRLMKKILIESDRIPYPGELTNLIKSSLAFSDKTKSYDYLKRMYRQLNSKEPSIAILKESGYSVREIEKITGISKSTVAREASQLTTT